MSSNEEIRNKYISGVTCEDISKQVNLSKSKIYSILRSFSDYDDLKIKFKEAYDKKLMDAKLKIRNQYITGKTCKEIAEEVNLSERQIHNILKNTFDDYEELKVKSKNERNKNINEKINDLYFICHKKEIDIAKELGVCQAQVTRVIKNSKKYADEKNHRHAQSIVRHKISINEINELRKSKREEENCINAQLARIQEINAIASSRRSKVSNNQIIKLCLQHYKLNKNGKLVFIENSGVRPNDVPGRENKAKYKPLKKGQYADDYLIE